MVLNADFHSKCVSDVLYGWMIYLFYVIVYILNRAFFVSFAYCYSNPDKKD